jgi:hypothetical protein
VVAGPGQRRIRAASTSERRIESGNCRGAVTGTLPGFHRPEKGPGGGQELLGTDDTPAPGAKAGVMVSCVRSSFQCTSPPPTTRDHPHGPPQGNRFFARGCKSPGWDNHVYTGCPARPGLPGVKDPRARIRENEQYTAYNSRKSSKSQEKKRSAILSQKEFQNF